MWVLKEFGIGGAERLLLEIEQTLRADVEFLPFAVSSQPRALEPAFRAQGLRTQVFGSRHELDLRWMGGLRRAVTGLRADIVHLHNPYPGAIGRTALIGCRVPIVYTEHSVWSSYHALTRVANAVTMPLSDCVIAVSAQVADAIQRSPIGRRLGDRLVTIPNGIDVRHVQEDASAQAAANGVVEVLSRFPGSVYGAVGHLRFRKGVDVLMKASLLVREQAPDAGAMVVGGGEDEDALRSMQATLGSEVELLGVRHDARGLMSRMDVFVVPSRVEGLPLALLEAMSLGLPIVATRVGGIPSVLTHERDALLVPAEDEKALAEAILRLLGDRALARSIGETARDTVTSRFSVESTANGYLAAYRRVLRR